MDLQAVARAEMAKASVEALSIQRPFKTPSGVAALRRGVKLLGKLKEKDAGNKTPCTLDAKPQTPDPNPKP